ncbi:unnamed protein product [Rotaria socialis]|uniref:Papilin n=1 Tax=Rotaria socialis TaxID=392032 RepID=A0A818HJL9_9BILA|nr:unnamed protein product [Rotaria socialis]CAF4090737.1 unnamed protein product [Rotaria socialis]
MTIFLNRQHNYLFFLIISCYLFLFTDANNDTDHHSNETIEEYNTTFISLTTLGNITDDTIVTDDNKNTSSELVDVTLLTAAVNATPFATSVPLEITNVNVIELSATLADDINDLTTILTQINETQVNAEKVEEEQTTMVSNTSCDLSKTGCCLTGKNDTNSEGCNDEMMNYVSISNSTTALNNDTESISTIKNDDMVMTTEKIEVSSEAINENTTSVIIDENVSTESNMHNATEAAIVEDSKENIDSITTEKFESITTEKVESATTEHLESITTTTTTITKIENITTQAAQTSTTTVRSTLCVDQDFECCPDGKTYAKGPDFDGCNTTVTWVPSTAKASSHGVCELEKDAGSCSKYVNMWAYDRQQGKCVRFWYGNCEGNGNRFETEQQCQETCISPKGIEVCLLSKVTGPCHANANRYYYDREKEECQQFHYGGCNGNANNYETMEKCQSSCVKETVDQCTQPVEVGPCKGEFTRYFYDVVTGQCRSFMYGGCKKNKNNFVTLKDCLKVCVEPRQKDICLQPRIIGTCQERRPTWYFDMVERECKLFQYSGCKGNHNQFGSKEECDLSCSSLKTSETLTNDIKSACHLPMVRGNCDQQISRWYFNPADQYCHSFQYTGCHGNANSFESEQDCRQICEAKEKDICAFEKDTGTCDQYQIMWYYDSSHGECKNFYYGSCGGNANRFGTEQECQLRCLIKAGNSTCFQQVDQGYTCNDTKSVQDTTTKPVLKFFYDQQLKKCSSFLYHGCGGNDNRFDEENQCVDKCIADVAIRQQGCGSNMIRCNIQCRFGFERDPNGCEICRCVEPCQRQQCPTGYQCVVIPEQTQCLQAPCPVPRVECQPITPDQTAGTSGGVKPIIENSITNIFSQFDANVTIPCSLRQGFPTPVVYWYKERQQLQVPDAMGSGLIVRKIERLPDQSLLIRKVRLEDQGLYTCRAINDFGQDMKDLQLEIFDSIKVDIYPINRIYQLGFTAKLQCRATGYPLPRITWMRNNLPLVNTTRIKLQNDGSLIIHPYKREDAGPYVCNATNKKESVTQVAYLEVKETRIEPTCEDQPTFANCELVLRHNFCDVYFDYCCHTCSQHGQYTPDKSTKSPNRRHVFIK